MSERKMLLAMVVWLLVFVAACGQVSEEDATGGLNQTGFQNNGSSKEYPDFVLTELFTGWGGLEEMWDSVETPGFNKRFTQTVDDYIDDFIVFSELGSKIIGDSSQVVIHLAATDGASLLDTLIDPEENYPLWDAGNSADHYFIGDGEAYMDGFYAFLDAVFTDGENPGSREMVSVHRKILSRMVDKKTPQALHDDMEELITDILDDDFKDDFIDVTTLLGKLMARADYPQVDGEGENLGIGNAVQGLVNVFKWYNRMEKNPVTRALLRSQVSELVSMFDPSPESDNHLKIRKLLINIEDCFTAEGAVYSHPDPSNIYSMDTDNVYSDAEIGNTLRELFPSTIQLLMRSDRPHAMIANAVDEQPVYLLRKMVDNLRALGFDPESADIETSVYNLMQYDMLGRDRMDPASGAYPASHLESLIFLTHLTANLGWQDRNNPDGSIVEQPEVSNEDDARYLHGHGDYTGRLSLNDSLFSIKTHKTLNSLGLFDIGLRPTDGNDLYRSRRAFTAENKANYTFFFDQNYDVLQCLAPPCVGDLGAPDGGNPDGHVYNGASDMNAFRAYSPDGLNENQLAAWTLGLIVRACFNGEGPYYYADPDAPHFMDGGKTWYAYKRPNGKLYAYVSKQDPEHWEYFYPADAGEPRDSGTTAVGGKNQRYNRYKAQWQSDYYMSRYTEMREVDGDIEIREVCKVPDNSSNRLQLVEVSSETGSAASLTYREAIAEQEPMRACASAEEALFRNYQWFMEEKKLVIIIPLKLDLAGPQAVVYQVLEANGLAGIANLRKFRGNHRWAKAGTDGESFIPGDYRIEVASSTDDPSNVLSALNIYETTLDCGHATPSVVGMNIQALSRLGFPRYTSLTERGDGIVDSELGSREFEWNDSTWNERSSVLPPFIALVAALREYTPPYGDNDSPLKKGIRTFAEGTSALLKPLIFYQKDRGVFPHDTWKPRVAGSEAPGPSAGWSDYQGDDFLRSSSDFNDNANHRAIHWNGTELERQFYQPAAEKNLLNVLIDSNLTAAPDDLNGFAGRRMDGLLPLMMENKSTTALLAALLSEVNDSDLLYSGLEQLASVMKITQGRMTEINGTNVKNIDFPSWMFVKGEAIGAYDEFIEFSGMRDEDVVLDRGIDRLIGHDYRDEDHDGYGIARYVDEQEAEDWADMDETLDLLEDLLHGSSDYSVVASALDMNEAVFGRDRLYTDAEISGLVYGLGKLMAHYDAHTDRWLYQGQDGFDDLLRILRVRLPLIHELVKDTNGFSGDHYRAVLELNRDMLRDDGPVEFLVTTMETQVGWEQLMADSAAFLKDEWVTNDAPMWSSFTDLLNDLARAVTAAQDGSLIESVYETYGFQRN